MGRIANAYYVQFLNQERRQEWLVPDPNGDRKLPPDLPVKWALLQVLTTQCWISAAAIKVLLSDMGYARSLSQIRRGLARCVKFGIADRMNDFSREGGILKGKKPHTHSKWKLTEKGRQLANTNPTKILKGKAKKIYVSAQQTVPCESSDGPSKVRVHIEPDKVLGT